MTLITFLTDYGTSDEFVGVCHVVIVRIAPQARVIDLGHGFDGVRAAAAALAQSVVYAPPAIHLAIVDPGVGTERRGIVVRSASGSMLVGPDNGLLLDAADALGGPVEAFELTGGPYRLEPVSATFHGRDVFAPAAAHLAAGVAPSELGSAIASDRLARLPAPHVAVSDTGLETDVLRCDRFGNVQLAATAADLEHARLGPQVMVHTSAAALPAVAGRTFADAAPGRLVVLVDSSGQVAVAANGGDAFRMLGHPESLRLSSRPDGGSWAPAAVSVR